MTQKTEELIENGDICRSCEAYIGAACGFPIKCQGCMDTVAIGQPFNSNQVRRIRKGRKLATR